MSNIMFKENHCDYIIYEHHLEFIEIFSELNEGRYQFTEPEPNNHSFYEEAKESA